MSSIPELGSILYTVEEVDKWNLKDEPNGKN